MRGLGFVKLAIVLSEPNTVYFQNSNLYPFHYDFATPFGGPREFGIQFVGLDAYPKEAVKAWFDVVKSAVLANPAATALYIPAFEQRQQAEIDRAWFASQGIEVSGVERWLVQSQIYAEGWALGRMVFVPGGQIQDLYGTDALRPGDVLLTDSIPAEIPFTAAVVTLTPATRTLTSSYSLVISAFPSHGLRGKKNANACRVSSERKCSFGSTSLAIRR